MSACTPATNAVDRLLVLLAELEQVIAEVREQALEAKEEVGCDRSDR